MWHTVYEECVVYLPSMYNDVLTTLCVNNQVGLPNTIPSQIEEGTTLAWSSVHDL